MKASLIPQHVFTLRVGDREITDLVRVSEWEGFVKLRDLKGRVVIVSKESGGFSEAFGEAFAQIFGGQATSGIECEIEKISPDLMVALMPVEQQKKAPA